MLLPVQAQQKSQILSDIRLTMQDFMADISNINEDKQYFKDNLQSLSQTYASDTYFMSNGVQQSSFMVWAEEYCTLHLTGLSVLHDIDILEHSLQKVDESNKNDKRYRFDATLVRTWSSGNQTTDNLNFVVVWNGRQNYVSLTEINGRLSSISEMNAEQLYSLASEQLKQGNQTLGLSLLKQAADKNNLPAINLLGKQYYRNRQYSEAYKWLMKADETSGEVCYMLGWIYEMGNGAPKDWWKAMEYYEKASKYKYLLAEQPLRKLREKMIANNMIYAGKVVNEQGKGLNSAAIHVQGTDLNYLTDLYGDFSINGLKNGDKLVVSNLGYETKVITWNTNTAKTITLKKIVQEPTAQQTTTQSAVWNNYVATDRTHGVCKGKVTDSKGNAINMALVAIEGTEIKVLTDYWGEYVINGLRPGDILVFSNPGCRTQKIRWDGQNLNVTLVKDSGNTQQAVQNSTATEKPSTTTGKSGNYVVTGKVTDSQGNGINSAIVGIEGTDIKVLTNYWGAYILKGLSLNDEIVVSNYGYRSQKKKFNGYRYDVSSNARVIDFTLLKETETDQATRTSGTYTRTTTPKPATSTTSQNRSTYTHSGKLSGYVKDRYTNKGINCALVQIEGTDIKVLTDLNGAFTLKGLKNGDKIIITNIGYKSGSHVWYKSQEKSIWDLFIEKK